MNAEGNDSERKTELEQGLVIDTTATADRLVEFIKAKVEQDRRDGVVIGVSGGIDSAVVVGLCAKALPKNMVKGLIMCEIVSSPETPRDARLVCEHYGITYEELSLSRFINPYVPTYQRILGRLIPHRLWTKIFLAGEKKLFQETGETGFFHSLRRANPHKLDKWIRKAQALSDLKHRLRMTLLYRNAELENRMVLSAANRTEWEVGYFVKWGADGAGDCQPILNLYKTQVHELAKAVDVPEKIRKKPPMPDTIPGEVDEAALGITYARLDPILFGMKKGLSHQEIADIQGEELKTVEYVAELIKCSEYMRQVYVPPES